MTTDYNPEGGEGFYLVRYGRTVPPVGPFPTVRALAWSTWLTDYPKDGYVVSVDENGPSSVPSLNPDDLAPDLSDDGDTADLPDGSTLRLTIEPTDIPPMEQINGWDCYGKVAWVEQDPTTGHSKDRPEGFDGAARKVWQSQNGDAFWWQPHPTVIAAGDEAVRREAQSISDLMTFGFCVVCLEVLDGKDAYGRPIVRDVASLGGIDSLDNGYLADILPDLVSELDISTD